VQRMSSHMGFAVDFVTQWVVAHGMLSCIGCCGFCRAVDFITHGMLSCKGFCCTEDVIVHVISSRSVFHRTVGCAHRIFLCTFYKLCCANDWFSDQLQYHFLTNWRGILKIPERFLLRTNQLIKTSLKFENCFIFWETRRNI
jgi:hypothetical protein